MPSRPLLLPPVPEPFTPPTDRALLPSERRTFVRTHRTCVFGYGRLHDGPAMSVVYYVPTEDDELLVSTMAARGKALAVARHPKVSLCVLDERWPFTYLQVYADAVVDRDRDLTVDVMMAVGARMTGEPVAEEARPLVAAMAAEEERVVLRCRPYETFLQPPRPVGAGTDGAALGPRFPAAVPWDATDEPAPDPTAE